MFMNYLFYRTYVGERKEKKTELDGDLALCRIVNESHYQFMKAYDCRRVVKSTGLPAVTAV